MDVQQVDSKRIYHKEAKTRGSRRSRDIGQEQRHCSLPVGGGRSSSSKSPLKPVESLAQIAVPLRNAQAAFCAIGSSGRARYGRVEERRCEHSTLSCS